MIPAWILAVLPLAGAGAIWLLPAAHVAIADLAIRTLTVLGCAGMFWVGTDTTPLALPIALLAAALSTLETAPRARLARCSEQVMLAGMLLAALATASLLAWFGLVMAAAAARVAVRDGRPEQDGVIGAAACLTLFALIALRAPPNLLPLGCLLLGQAVLVATVPGLLPLVPLLLARFRETAAATPHADAADALLLVLGLAAALACAGLLLMRPRQRDRVSLLIVGQGGIGVFAFGLGSAEGVFAGLIHLLLLAITRSAIAISRSGRPERLAGVLGMAGVPPFGVWPGLVLIVLATAHHTAWLIAPVSLALGGMAWAIIGRLPAPQWGRPAVPSLAWLPLALTVVIGLAMPDPVVAWLRGLIAVPG